MAAPTVVQATGQNGPGSQQLSVSKAFASNVTSGNLIIVAATCWHGFGATLPSTAITDSQGNTYTRRAPSSDDTRCIWTAPVGSSAACTVTVTQGGGNSNYLSLAIMEVSYSGSLTYIWDTGGVSSGTTLTTGDVSPSTGALLLGAMSLSNDPSAITENGSWTLWQEDQTFNNVPWSAIYRTVAAGTYTAEWTITNTVTGGGHILSIEASSSATYTTDCDGGEVICRGGTLQSNTIPPEGVFLLVDYVDQSHRIIERPGRRGVKIDLQLGGEWRATCDLYDRDSTSSAYRPAINEQFQLFYQGQMIFNGVITRVEDRPRARTDAYVVTRVTAKHGLMLTEQIEVNNSTFDAGQTLKQALTALRDQNNPGLWSFGVVLDPNMDDGPTLQAVTFDRVLMQDAFNRLMDRTRRMIRLTPDYILQAFEVGDEVCPYSLTDSNALAWGSLTWEQSRNRKNYVNRVNLRYNEGADVVTVEDTASITAENLWERTFEHPEITTLAEATEQANGYIRIGIETPKEITVRTREYPMPLPGDVITLSFPNRTITNGSYLITRVQAEDYKDATLEFTLTCVSGSEPKRVWLDLYRQAVRA